MGFRFHAHAPLIVPSNDAGVVVEHREKPVDLVLHVMRWLHDVRFEEGIDDRVFARLFINVMDF